MRDTKAKATARKSLGAALALAGVSHLTVARKAFQAQVPDLVPKLSGFNKDHVVLLSGVAEIILGGALVLAGPRQRQTVGWIAAGFFTAVFPGNIAQYVHRRDAFGLNTDRKRFLRLFLQPALVAWAIKSA